jgi:N-acetylglucosaminyldiphosphoundecaprenol N-acetyl-beta-D-mannosaminyltransferase
MLNEIKILNVKITNETEENVLEYLYKRIKKSSEKTFIITPNPEMLVYASKHLDYLSKLNSANIALPDGIGLFFAGGILGRPLKERITGVDFLEKLCKKSKENPLSIGLLGGKDGVAKATAECLRKKYPWVSIVFSDSEWPQNENVKSIDVLFVAYGVPKQELWIAEHLDSLPVKAAVGVGGAFDYLSGTVARAPYIVRLFGFEWLFRLIMQPWRWRRQLALLEFIILVVKERFSSKS